MRICCDRHFTPEDVGYFMLVAFPYCVLTQVLLCCLGVCFVSGTSRPKCCMVPQWSPYSLPRMLLTLWRVVLYPLSGCYMVRWQPMLWI